MPLLEGRFLRRCSRFAAEIEIGGNVEYCHVKNTGRLRELLVPGARVWCEVHDGAKRKTRCSLVLVEAAGTLVSIDSLAPNRIAFEYVRAGGLGFVPEALRREVTRGDSRFDLWFRHGESEGFLEVKGVTLMEEGTARFPDAPTERGVKHLRGLQRDVYKRQVRALVRQEMEQSASIRVPLVAEAKAGKSWYAAK